MAPDTERAFAAAPTAMADDLQFHSWFNRATSVQQSVSSGFTDFVHRIFTQDFYPMLGDPADKQALEIGYGGGRLLLPAASFFRQVIGIDIHGEPTRVGSHLRAHGCTNYALLQPQDAADVPDRSVDFAYSFITFQHFSGWDVADGYLQLLQRVVSDDGCGILYFGRNDADGQDVRVVQPTDFADFPMTLYVKPEFARREVERRGFIVTDCATGTKHPWSSAPSRQFYVKFRRDW